MKRWFLEEMTNTDGFTTRLDAKTRDEAEKEARDIFERLDKRDQERRIEVFAIYTEEDEDGIPDMENIEDEIVIK